MVYALWKYLFAWMSIFAGEYGYKGVEVGWGCESGGCWIFGCWFDHFRGWSLDDDCDCFGRGESGEEEADWKSVFECFEWRI